MEDNYNPRNLASFLCGIRYWSIILVLNVVLLSFPLPGSCSPDQIEDTVQTEVSSGMEIIGAVICEDVKDGRPVNKGIIFSSSLNRVTCFTEFDRITEKTIIYHCWYFKDNLRAKRKPLVLNPPKWSTYSQIEPRETDKGPWRVEIIDEEGNILQTLRFSIVD